MVAHSYNPRIQRLKRKGCYKFKVSLGYIARYYLRKENKNKENRKIEKSRLAALGFWMEDFTTETGHTV